MIAFSSFSKDKYILGMIKCPFVTSFLQHFTSYVFSKNVFEEMM